MQNYTALLLNWIELDLAAGQAEEFDLWSLAVTSI